MGTFFSFSASWGASICTVGEDNEWLWAERYFQTRFWTTASEVFPAGQNDWGEMSYCPVGLFWNSWIPTFFYLRVLYIVV